MLKVEKYDFTLHPDAKKLIPKKASDHIPKWREDGRTDEYDYLPKPPPKPRRTRPAPSGRPRKEPASPVTQPVYQEPEYEPAAPTDDCWSDSSDMVPLDKNSIMS